MGRRDFNGDGILAGDGFPGLTMSDRFHETVGLGVEKDEMGKMTIDFRLCCKIRF